MVEMIKNPQKKIQIELAYHHSLRFKYFWQYLHFDSQGTINLGCQGYIFSIAFATILHLWTRTFTNHSLCWKSFVVLKDFHCLESS